MSSTPVDADASDPEFEAGLSALFNTAPAASDARDFASGVMGRLDRRDRRRRCLLFAAASAGGAVAASGVAASGVLARLPAMAHWGSSLTHGWLERVLGDLSSPMALHALSSNGELRWVALAGAVLASLLALQQGEAA